MKYAHETAFLGNKPKEKQATSPMNSNRFCKGLQCSPKCSWSKCEVTLHEKSSEKGSSAAQKSKWRCWKPLVCSWLLCSLFTQVTQPAGQQILQTKLGHLLCTIPQGEKKKKRRRWNATPLIYWEQGNAWVLLMECEEQPRQGILLCYFK